MPRTQSTNKQDRSHFRHAATDLQIPFQTVTKQDKQQTKTQHKALCKQSNHPHATEKLKLMREDSWSPKHRTKGGGTQIPHC